MPAGYVRHPAEGPALPADVDDGGALVQVIGSDPGVRKVQVGPLARVSRWSRVASGASNSSATATYQAS